MNHPDDVPTSLTRRAYALRGVTVSQNEYAAVIADAYEDIKREVLREAAEKIREAKPILEVARPASPNACALAMQAALADLIDPDKDN